MQKALASVPGVRKATTDLKSKTAAVTYEPAKAGVADLVAAVKKAGFEATPKS